jgi:2-polyprenyl-3-methyl-5-hydroxy-6-metoxy-1,4-benzoquinol methylase
MLTKSEIPEVLGPMSAPHDRLPFEELARRYNFRQTSDWQAMFVRLLLDECRRIGPSCRALDIGCGHGIGRKPAYTSAVRDAVGELWGIEPDTGEMPTENLFHNFQHAMMETATLPEGYFDLAYSFMVVEHVANPEPYMRAVSRCLKPGGVHFFLTVNGAHYFARMASALRAMRADELVLRVIRGKQEVAEYHYPVQYRMNTPRAIDRVAASTGFDKPEYVFIEEWGPEPYMKGPLRLAWHALNAKRRVIKNPRALLALYARMRRAQGAR